jgi:hypothetical protein
VNHGLFVPAQEIAKVIAVLVKRLAQTSHVAMTEDAKATGEEVA